MFSQEGFGLLGITAANPAILSEFDCGKPELNTFLRESAPDLHRKRLSFTSLVFHENHDGILGYFALCSDAIPLNDSEIMEVDGDISLNSFPAVKLGKYAIASSCQGNGVGKQVLNLILGEILAQGSLYASRLLVVDAAPEERVIKFYEAFGFQKSLWAENRATHHRKRNSEPSPVKMWLDILRAL